MEVTGKCHKLNLRVSLPDSTQCCLRFPQPLPSASLSSTATATATTTTPTTPTTSSFSNEVEGLSDLEKLKVIGHGNGGTVYQVRHKRTSTIYALKIFRGDCDKNEMEILRRTNSPFIIRCHGIFEEPFGDNAILMEYMDGGTVDTYLKSHGSFSELSLSNIARQVLKGLNYLHSQKIVHRDIKPTNLLVNQKMEVKIADFGTSKIMRDTLQRCDSFVGTCAYMSPERLDQDTYGGSNYDGYAADVWSLGLTLWELYVGHFPLLSPDQRPDRLMLILAICVEELPSLPDSASEEFQSFVKCCLQKDFNQRWTVSQLLSHPFVANNQESENR